MYNGKDIILSWDSTAINEEHINEIHMFLDGKVKCKINGTMQWLCAHSEQARNFASDKLRE